ncbi:MAG: RNA polymerase sigma factor WhiG [Anaerolineae bacterium]
MTPRERTPSATKETTEDRLEALWAEYIATRDPVAREQLILAYAPLVKRIIGRMGIQPFGSIEEDDLIGYGIVGLIEAIERFDPERGYKFETYATSRIRGSVLDALRALDPLSRSARKRVTLVREAIGFLQKRFGRMPTDEEVLTYTGMSQEAYEQALTEAGFAILSLDAPLSLDGDDQASSLGDVLGDQEAQLQLERLEEEELREELRRALKKLPQREQLLLSLYYNESLTMREIGEVLGLSQARVCQLHNKAILYLRAVLQAAMGG